MNATAEKYAAEAERFLAASLKNKIFTGLYITYVELMLAEISEENE